MATIKYTLREREVRICEAIIKGLGSVGKKCLCQYFLHALIQKQNIFENVHKSTCGFSNFIYAQYQTHKDDIRIRIIHSFNRLGLFRESVKFPDYWSVSIFKRIKCLNIVDLF